MYLWVQRNSFEKCIVNTNNEVVDKRLVSPFLRFTGSAPQIVCAFMPSPLYFGPRTVIAVLFFGFFPVSLPTYLFKNTALGKKKRALLSSFFFSIHHILLLSLHCTQCTVEAERTLMMINWHMQLFGDSYYSWLFFFFGAPISHRHSKRIWNADVSYCSHDFVTDLNLLSSHSLISLSLFFFCHWSILSVLWWSDFFLLCRCV